jgi:hypothetical protein
VEDGGRLKRNDDGSVDVEEISLLQLQRFFCKYKIKEAALVMCIGVTKLKKLCRSFGVIYWPKRKVPPAPTPLRRHITERGGGWWVVNHHTLDINASESGEAVSTLTCVG